MLSVRSLCYSYPGASAAALSEVSLQVGAGECVCLTGHSGCGKTTLLRALKGLLRGGKLSGAVEVAGEPFPPPASGAIGLVLQNADSQNFCSTVAEEVAFGPENQCVPEGEIGLRLRRALGEVGLLGCWDRNVERLSAGQKHRLAIAAVLSTCPRVLLLDEPTAQLDAPGKAEVVDVLRRLKASGCCLVVAEHDLAALGDVVDRYAVMVDGRIDALTDRPPAPFVGPAPSAPGAPGGTRSPSTPAVWAKGLRLAYPGVGPVLRGVDLEAAPGERVHLTGRNGCGKSTLLACLAGAQDTDAGQVEVAGRQVTARSRLVGVVGYLFQNPERQLFEETVTAEVAFSLKRLGRSPSTVEGWVTEALELCEAAHLSARPPLSLSLGEQHRVALASVLAPRPAVLLLDEPFAGLDLAQRRRLLGILAALRDRQGTTLILASHDPVVDPAWADRVVTLEEGRLA